MAVRPGGIEHRRFRDLPGLLEPGDLVVVNTSATLPARIDARGADDRVVPLHVSTELDDGSWVVEVRRPHNDGPDLGVEPGTVLLLPGGVWLHLQAPYPVAGSRLWRARTDPQMSTAVYLPAHGRPIGYRHLSRAVRLPDLQNVYADEPGSAEMASAG